MFNLRLVTHQTGPEGRPVHRVYIECGVKYDRELYYSILNDRSTGGINIIGSTQGGVDIEGGAEKLPEKNLKIRPGPAAPATSSVAHQLPKAVRPRT